MFHPDIHNILFFYEFLTLALLIFVPFGFCIAGKRDYSSLYQGTDQPGCHAYTAVRVVERSPQAS